MDDPVGSIENFVFSIYGAMSLLALLCVLAVLWSDQLKRRWYDRVERKKWQQWNVPKAAENPPAKLKDNNLKP